MRRIVTVTPHRGRSRSRRRGRLTTLGATVAAAALAVLAHIAAVADESTTVGYVRVTVPGNGGVALVGLNFGRANGTGPLRASEVFGGQLESGAAPELADTLYRWNPDRGEGGGYDTVFQRGDGTFWDAETMAALDPEIPTGTAVFVRTRLGTAERRIFLMGEVPDAAQQSLAVPAGLMALASPYAAALDLNQAAGAAWSGATAALVPSLADNVWIWNPAKQAGGGYEIFFLHSSTRKWHRIDAPGAVADAAVIALGGGAFYHARRAFASQLSRPYPR